MDTSPRVTAGPRLGSRLGVRVIAPARVTDTSCTTSATTRAGPEWRVLESGMCLTVGPGIADYWARLGARPGFKAAKRAQKIERQNCSVTTAPA
jgi:hypothetical protein